MPFSTDDSRSLTMPSRASSFVLGWGLWLIRSGVGDDLGNENFAFGLSLMCFCFFCFWFFDVSLLARGEKKVNEGTR